MAAACRAWVRTGRGRVHRGETPFKASGNHLYSASRPAEMSKLVQFCMCMHGVRGGVRVGRPRLAGLYAGMCTVAHRHALHLDTCC